MYFPYLPDRRKTIQKKWLQIGKQKTKFYPYFTEFEQAMNSPQAICVQIMPSKEPLSLAICKVFLHKWILISPRKHNPTLI